MAWAALIALAFLCTYAAYYCYYIGLKHLEPTRAAITATMEPVMGGEDFSRFALGGEIPIAIFWLGSIEAAKIAAADGHIADEKQAMASYALGLRLTVALSVGFAIVIGVFRILRGWPIQYLIISGYIGVVIMTAFAPPEIIGIAYDSGGVTTSTVTVPLVTALGVGLASSIKGRNPMTDGFGLIAFASLTPMIFVMGYGMVMD